MLTDKQIKALKPREKLYRVTDGGGLSLEVTAAGGKHWRWRYEVAGREKMLAVGTYPEMGLSAAREARDKAKGLLRDGRDPSVEKRLRRVSSLAAQQITFEGVARQWHEHMSPTWSDVHRRDVLHSLESWAFPLLGAIPLGEITAPMVLRVLRDIEARPAVETAHRVRQRIFSIYVYAIASGIAESNPASMIKGALKKVAKARMPALTDVGELREMLRRVDETPARPLTRLALRLLALTAVRPGEVCGAAWAQFEGLDGNAPVWRLPAAMTKMKREHVVTLSRQAVEVVQVTRALTGRFPMLFPNARAPHTPMSPNAMGYLLNRAGYHARHVPHGWRAGFSSIMNERHRADRDLIDMMLSHRNKDRTEAAYNRAEHLIRRRELSQDWADLLLEGAPPASELLLGERR